MARLAAASAVLAAAGASVLVLSGPALAAVCDAYSGTCTEPPRVLPSSLAPGTTTVVSPAQTRSTGTPSTLPFTGGEVVLVSAAGAAAVAGGAALVVAGRRRSVPQD